MVSGNTTLVSRCVQDAGGKTLVVKGKDGSGGKSPLVRCKTLAPSGT